MAFSSSSSSSSSSLIKEVLRKNEQKQGVITAHTDTNKNIVFQESLAKMLSGKRVVRKVIEANQIIVAYTCALNLSDHQLEIYKINQKEVIKKQYWKIQVEASLSYDFNGNQIVAFQDKTASLGDLFIYDVPNKNLKAKNLNLELSRGNVHWLPDGNYFFCVSMDYVLLCCSINSSIQLEPILRSEARVGFIESYRTLSTGEIVCQWADYAENLGRFDLHYDPYALLPEWTITHASNSTQNRLSFNLDFSPPEGCRLNRIDNRDLYLPERKTSPLESFLNKEFATSFQLLTFSITGLENFPIDLIKLILSYICLLDRTEPFPKNMLPKLSIFQASQSRKMGLPTGNMIRKLNLLEKKLNETICILNSESKTKEAEILLKTKILLLVSELRDLLKKKMDMSYDDILKKISVSTENLLGNPVPSSIYVNDQDYYNLRQTLYQIEIYCTQRPLNPLNRIIASFP